MSNNYKYKYLKYKNKYLSLKMKGGGNKLLTQADLTEVMAFRKLIDEQKTISYSGKIPYPAKPDHPANIKWTELEGKLKTEKDRLISKGIPNKVLFDKIYWNLDFYKIDDKIKADNIKKNYENDKLIYALKKTTDSAAGDYKYDRSMGSTKQYQESSADKKLYDALLLEDYYKKWFDYHGITSQELTNYARSV